MGEVHYMISETAKQVGVDTHVLFEWENEYKLSIGRTEMGHRFYTNENIQLFRCIKKLKEQGVTCTELKKLIPDLLIKKAQRSASLHGQAIETERELTIEDSRDIIPEHKDELAMIAEVLEHVIIKNNDVLKEYITDGVSQKVVKEMEFLLEAKERSEEERYRSLDHLIRQQQIIRRESAKAAPLKRLLKLIGEV